MPTWKKYAKEDAVIPKSLLTEQGDIIYASAASTPAALPHGTSSQYLKSGGDAANPSWDTPAGGGAVIKSGSYTGDGTVNRAIAHGVGAISKIVFIFDSTARAWGRIMNGQATIPYIDVSLSADANLAVTAPNSTNFYIGEASSSVQSFNLSPRVYFWIAIG